MALIAKPSIEAVVTAADMVEIVSARTPLRRVGARWVGRCPFHEERTPSFSVNAVEKLFYCFGCGKGGDLISFVRVTADRTRIFGVASFTGFIAWDAGLQRPESQRFDATSQDLSPEELHLADADRIFYSVQGATTEAQAAESATVANPLWQSLPAVREGRAVLVDDDPWYLNAGPTAARLVLAGLEAALVSSG